MAVLAPLTACGAEAETEAVPETEVVRVDTLVDTLVDGPAKTDLDGDEAITLGKDQYGFMASTLGLVNFQVSLGISVVGKDEEGYLTSPWTGTGSRRLLTPWNG